MGHVFIHFFFVCTFVVIMPKELYIYSSINNDSALAFLQSMEDNANEDVVIRVNSPGGSVFSFWGMAAKMNEMKGKKTIKVDGLAASAGAFFLLYGDTVEALDVSTLMIHRADAYISSPEDQARLDLINTDLRAKLTAKIDDKKMKELKGVSIKDLFNPDTRIDLFLTAKEAKAIGLVDKITKVNPKEASAFTEAFANNYFNVAAEMSPAAAQTQTPKVMTLAEFKAANPALYNEILELGVAQEKDRVEAALVFNDIDPKGVKAAIESGKPLSQKQMAEFALKQMSPEALKKLEVESAKVVTTTATEETVKTEKEKEVAAFEAELDEKLKLKA